MDDLVLAMPCSEFIAIRGFSPKMELAVLDSLQDDTWFTLPTAVNADPTAVIVHLGLLVTGGDQVLVGADGRLLHQTTIPPDAMEVKTGLAALKRYAEQRSLVEFGQRGRVELAGLVYEPKLLPRQVILVYRSVLPSRAVVGGCSWRTAAEISARSTDWLDQIVLPALPRNAPA